VIGCLVLVLFTACSDDEDCATCPENPVSFREVPGAALYGEADYEGMLLYVVSDGTVERCKGICEGDPECTFFYFNARGDLDLVPLSTDLNDCAFFRGTLWVGAAGNTDTYVKQINGVDAWETAKASWD